MATFGPLREFQLAQGSQKSCMRPCVRGGFGGEFFPGSHQRGKPQRFERQCGGVRGRGCKDCGHALAACGGDAGDESEGTGRQRSAS